MSHIKNIYRVLRSVIFTLFATLVGLVALIYMALSIPVVTDAIKNRAETELTDLLGGKVSIAHAEIFPFNEVRLHNVALYTPQGERCVEVERLGAGIDLWHLVTSGEIAITYAEIIRLNALIRQESEHGSYNIQYLIDALAPKQNQEKKDIRLVLHNIVVRKSDIRLRRPWMESAADKSRLDLADIRLKDINADLSFPAIRKDDIRLNLRRLAFKEQSGLDVRSLSLKAHISPDHISVKDFALKIGDSEIAVSDQSVIMDGFRDLLPALKSSRREVGIVANPLYLSDFSSLVPQLSNFNRKLYLSAEVEGSPDNFRVDEFKLLAQNGDCDINMSGIDVIGMLDPANVHVIVKDGEIGISRELSSLMASSFGIPVKASDIISRAGDLKINLNGDFDAFKKRSEMHASVSTDAGNIETGGEIGWNSNAFSLKGLSLQTETFDVGTLLGTELIGSLSCNMEGSLEVRGNSADGEINATIPFVDIRGQRVDNIELELSKLADNVTGKLVVDDPACKADLSTEFSLLGESSQWAVDAVVERFYPGLFSISGFNQSQNVSGAVFASLSGNRPEDMTGEISLNRLEIEGGKFPISLDGLTLTSDKGDNRRSIRIDSDLLNGQVEGNFNPRDMIRLSRNLVYETFPVLFAEKKAVDTSGQFANLEMVVNPSDNLFKLINMPLMPGVPVTITGHFDGDTKSVSLNADAPYLIKGQDKLIKSSYLSAILSDREPAKLSIGTSFPLKRDRANALVNISALANKIEADLCWTMSNNEANRGNIGLDIDLFRDLLSNGIGLRASLTNSSFNINGAEWLISPANVEYSRKKVSVDNLHIWHDLQFLDINGSASADPLDTLTVDLAGIDLSYLFDILNIKHVDFGGIATGKAIASSVFSSNPVAKTENLFVKNLAYNGCVVGDGNLESHWDNDRKMVAINADILAADTASTIVRGGIFVAKDSLDLNFKANKTDVALLKPFMKGFTSDVRGKASGDIKVYGTFANVDLAGRVFADTISMKVDYTNVYYNGSDSVFFMPGLISIPRMRVYDKYGNSGILTGEVRHDFLRDASFKFDLSEALNLLVYDTDASAGTPWYGRVFASGNAKLRGAPGGVILNIDVATTQGTNFTIALDETQTAAEYNFLTFTDKSKPVEVSEQDTFDFESRFIKRESVDSDLPHDLFILNMSLSVNPAADIVLLMDPKTGDRIKANGTGALQMDYNSESDKFNLYGKYILENGDYNFSLQDLILKKFNIRPGSSISFNGDPMDGILDITAAYRVNTNLTDLDASFRDDPDLTRTSIPVDALLHVRGNIETPEIKFDISLPTVTSEVERKMRSIVSTEDMMNQQVIYLLALNRFYSPEYTSGERGGELASVASSTISSQIQNIIGSVTDKFSLAPSIKSEKSDLSDMEFDVALSSKLFDNRLLINGNVGYRDKSTSQTTFVGDFDVEYLLNRQGYLRLKAYNHFNDASYYLKSALTTQGVGIVYRRDFDDAFQFLKVLNRKRKEPQPAKKANK